MLASKAWVHHQHQLCSTFLYHLLWLEVHQGVHDVQACEEGRGRVYVVVCAVGEQLGDVVDLDCSAGPDLQGTAEHRLGMCQERLQCQRIY